MRDFYLKFSDQSEFMAVYGSLELPNIVLIGKIPGKTGFHVNVRSPELPPQLVPFVLEPAPETPFSVWL
ncbi:hypothetical protein GCM10027347_58960 [Larkinella harenae]